MIINLHVLNGNRQKNMKIIDFCKTNPLQNTHAPANKTPQNS